jgi:hypothetical protein
VNASQNGKLALWRKRGFRFVEDVKAFAAEAVSQEGKERFPVRLLVQGTSAVGVNEGTSTGGPYIQVLNFRRYVEKALGPEKEPVPGALNAFRDSQVLV